VRSDQCVRTSRLQIVARSIFRLDEAALAQSETAHGLVSSRDVMAVDPDFLAVAIAPMSRLPNVIDSTRPVSRAANIIWSVANCDCDRARIAIIGTIASVVGSTIIRSVARVRTIIPFAARRAQRGENQNQHQSKPTRLNSSFMLCGDRFYLRMINSAHLHPFIDTD
jgi:hypothetical protein